MSPPPTVVPDSMQELRFTSTDAAASFECRLGNGVFIPCTSPFSIAVGEPREYSGEVRAVGSNGLTDTHPGRL